MKNVTIFAMHSDFPKTYVTSPSEVFTVWLPSILIKNKELKRIASKRIRTQVNGFVLDVTDIRVLSKEGLINQYDKFSQGDNEKPSDTRRSAARILITYDDSGTDEFFVYDKEEDTLVAIQRLVYLT